MVLRNSRQTAFAGLIVFLSAAFLSMGAAPAEALETEVRFSWSESDQGTPAIHYVMEIEKRHGEELDDRSSIDNILEPTHVILVEYGFKYRVRVAGVDAQGHQGPWSLWSELFTPEVGPSD